MPRIFNPSVKLAATPSPTAHVWVFLGQELCVLPGAPSLTLPSSEQWRQWGIALEGAVGLGSLAEVPCVALALPEGSALPEGLERHSLRALYGRLEEEHYAIAVRAVQLLRFDREHRFCGSCGTPTQHLAGELARVCPACELHVYPRLSPAIIVLIRDGDRALLGWGKRFPEPVYSTLAGFVEPGETVEEAVAREVQEEVGVQVKNLRYFGSQPWPYPHALMLGFMADWAGGDIRVDPVELVDAQWFHWDALPRIPPRLSISRQLIDAFVEEHRQR